MSQLILFLISEIKWHLRKPSNFTGDRLYVANKPPVGQEPGLGLLTGEDPNDWYLDWKNNRFVKKR